MVNKRGINGNISPGSLAEETRKSFEIGIKETNTELNSEPIQKLAQMAEGKSDDVANGSHGIQTNISDSMYVRMMTAKAKSRKTFGVIYREALEMYLKSMGV